MYIQLKYVACINCIIELIIYKVVSKNYKGCSSYCCCLRVTSGLFS